MFINSETLKTCAELSEIGLFFLAITGLSIWTGLIIKTQFIKSGIINVYKREKWLWSHIGVFHKYIKRGRQRWNKCHDYMGNEIKTTDKATMDDIFRFSKWGFFDEDGLSPTDRERNEELKKKYPDVNSTV